MGLNSEVSSVEPLGLQWMVLWNLPARASSAPDLDAAVGAAELWYFVALLQHPSPGIEKVI